MHKFDEALQIECVDIDLFGCGLNDLPWDNFLLNPRRLRGSDFLMRWSQGVWSEHRLLELINSTKDFFALPYGPSGTAPHDDVRSYELYFERLEEAGLGSIKRPDLLLFEKKNEHEIMKLIHSFGGSDELPFINEDKLAPILELALIGIECENSLWIGKKMPDYNAVFKPQKRLNGQLGLKKAAVLPTIIVKEEDMEPLKKWQDSNKKMIHVWHSFYDEAFGIPFNEVLRLVEKGLIEPTVQIFQAPGGATTKKRIYKVWYQYGYKIGETIEEPNLTSDHIVDKNGHILPFVRFEGGHLKIANECVKVLSEL